MLPYVNLNGTVIASTEARVSVYDHGLLYGDGLFETLRVERGRLLGVEAHLERLERGAEQIRLDLPWTAAELTRALDETRAINGLQAGALRLTVTRGVGPPVPDAAATVPAFIITARHTPPLPEGIRACFAGRHPQAHFPGIKSLSYQPFALARQEAQRRGFQEALLCVEQSVIEGSISNVFAVIGGALRTPAPLDSGCIPGTMRARVIELAAEADVPVAEMLLRRAEVRRADELFITSALAGVLPIIEVEDERIGNGKVGRVSRRLQEALAARLALDVEA